MAMKAQNRKARAADPAKAGQISTNQEMIATAMLKADHRKVEQLFKKYEQLEDDAQKGEIAHQICHELIVHTVLEEEIFYPACREKLESDESGDKALDEAQVEHDGAKTLINDLLSQSPGSDFYDAKVKVLSDYIKHHVGEEERSSDGIFAKAEKAGIDMAALGRRLQARKSTLMAQGNSLERPKPRSLHLDFNQRDTDQEDQNMNRYSNYRDRDEQGRFTSDDDRDDRGRYASSRRSYRSDDDDRDYRPRSSAQGYGDLEEDYGRRGGGRYSETETHQRMGRSRDEDRYGRRGRDYDEDEGRGWYGESERHSEASRQGWEGRGGYRSSQRDYGDEERDERYGRQGSYQDESYRGSSRGQFDDDRRSYESRGRGRGRSSYEEDDDDRRSRGSSSGHGGWYGDSRGHAAAARRGWQNRD